MPCEPSPKPPAVTLALVRRMAADGTAKRLRLQADLSLAELGRDVGVPASTILRWERGDSRPRGELAQRYAQVLSELAEVLEP